MGDVICVISLWGCHLDVGVVSVTCHWGIWHEGPVKPGDGLELGCGEQVGWEA